MSDVRQPNPDDLRASLADAGWDAVQSPSPTVFLRGEALDVQEHGIGALLVTTFRIRDSRGAARLSPCVIVGRHAARLAAIMSNRGVVRAIAHRETRTSIDAQGLPFTQFRYLVSWLGAPEDVTEGHDALAFDVA